WKRCGSSSTATVSNAPLSTAARTASSLLRETCAVPSRVKRTPSRSTMACGCPRQAASAASVTVALEQVAVRVDAAVAQERPDAAHVLAAAQVHFGQQHLRRVHRRFAQELALRAEHVARAPEIDAGAADRPRLSAGAVSRHPRQSDGGAGGTAAL